MPTEITILATRILPSLDPKRAGQQDTMVVFRSDGAGAMPDHVVLPSEKPSQADVQAAIRERLKTRSNLEGTKFTV